MAQQHFCSRQKQQQIVRVTQNRKDIGNGIEGEENIEKGCQKQQLRGNWNIRRVQTVPDLTNSGGKMEEQSKQQPRVTTEHLTPAVHRDASANGHPVLFFDGVCNLCNGLVDFFLRRDRVGRVRFAPLQSEVAKQLLTQHRAPRDSLDTVVLLHEGRIYVKSDAVLHLCRDMRFPWFLLSYLQRFPRRWRDAVYDWIARHRYRWFGRRPTCRLPDQNEIHRFLA